MRIERVTFTGADDSVRPEDILRVVEEYRKDIRTEWALLLSKNNEGRRSRYPTLAWMEEFIKQASDHLWNNKHNGMAIAGHMQGQWLRSMVDGKNALKEERPTLWPYLERIQLNFHGVKSKTPSEEFYSLLKAEKGYIIQMDGVNEDIYHEAVKRKILSMKPLFDLSAGQGIVPDKWPKPLDYHLNGYAGGLGPETIKKELKRIQKAVGSNDFIWIDMETRIRSDNDQLFDLNKCRRVLDAIVEQL